MAGVEWPEVSRDGSSHTDFEDDLEEEEWESEPETVDPTDMEEEGVVVLLCLHGLTI